ncbi:UDP-3-O-(3-hydroxymyristoyl)glucosamine N-acyltransferase [Thiomicrorhabdus sp.]|uniref:UDP-3-O-(3-hydroxymyristoyl)glucosamine N-acyltransferase n=1 Tax=Thiomicrorhabdus sp. TaxID=2039724 RepID=UPI0035644823
MQLKAIVDYLKEAGIAVEVRGTDTVEINQVASLVNATKGNISFLSDKKRLHELKSTQASVVISHASHAEYCQQTCLIVDNPYYVYAKVAQFLNPEPEFKPGIHDSAIVSSTASLGKNVSIHANVVIEDGVKIGDDTVIMAGSYLGKDVTIGMHCRIAPNVVIMHACKIGNYTAIESGAVIGGDGFGWANYRGQWVKIPQIGKVVIGDHVSIGNNTTVDRGAIEDTVIADNSIIDNLVQIGHNVQLGEGTAIAGQAGFAGSTIIGKHCTIAGQAGFAGHISIADGTHIMAKAGVTHSLNEPGVYAGFPAIAAGEWQKNSVRARQLDKIAKKIKSLEDELKLLKENSPN